MKRLRAISSRVLATFRSKPLDADLDEEVRAHLDMLVDDHRRRGLSPADARKVFTGFPGIRLDEFPTPRRAVGIDDVLVGRVRRDTAAEHGLALFVVADNLRKGAALNAIQIAELILDRRAVAA